MIGTWTLSRSGVLLCEGAADQSFFRKLLKDRGLPQFDMLPPDQHFGVTNIGNMLRTIRGDAIGFSGVRGILIAVDSADDPSKVFSSVAKQIADIGEYPVPEKPDTRVVDGEGRSLLVTLLPSSSASGALESLLLADRYNREPWIEPIVQSYLSHERLQAMSWSPEKRDKAQLHALIAGRCSDDPSRSASSVFRKPAVTDIKSPCFDAIAAIIADFCTSSNVD